MAEALVDGVDLVALMAWMDEQGLGAGELTEVEQLTGGTQNILVRFVRRGRGYVLRHPPPHKRARSDDTMRREARVLGAIADTDVPHPRLIAACGDVDVLGSAFFLMEPIDGFNVIEGLPEPHASRPDWQAEMSLSMADAIAALGRVDHEAVGLGDFGKPGWLERQVERWRSHLEGYGAFDGYPGPDIPRVHDIAEWLRANQPTEWKPGIIHGDFHAGNVLFHRDRPTLAAAVDWELSTIGDPLIDLGHFLGTSALTSGLGLPGQATRREIIDRYGAGSERDLSAIDWYEVMACYRLGIILEGTHARAFAGKAPVEIGDQLHATTVALFTHAATLL